MTASAEPVAVDHAVGWRFDNTYARLPQVFFTAARPASVREPGVSLLNFALADELGLKLRDLPATEAAKLFAGQVLPDGSQPIAQAYAGHQYGHPTMLGDGRAILLGEHRTPTGQLVDIQFKGPGQTPFSRRGDGRAALGPMLREYVISEAMHALGIPTTRSLAVVTTGETVYREAPLRGAVLTRVAASHIRVGTFEYAARCGDPDAVKILADYTIERQYPELVASPQKYVDFLRAVIDRQAALIAQWQMVGFIHGVMNTDNTAISGETIDYGPCAFMNTYDPATVFSSIDRHGRYAYGQQPAIAQWNLARFAESLLPLIDQDDDKAIAIATQALEHFETLFNDYWLAGMRRKLGLRTSEADDRQLVQSLLDWMQSAKWDFTNTWRDLSEGNTAAECYRATDFESWQSRWQERLQREGTTLVAAHATMQTVNPAVIPRNHRVEEALLAAEQRDDLTPFHRLVAVLTSPYTSSPDTDEYRTPPVDEAGYRTFCGT
ncbi:MAG TPA: YdiU family protein [Planctomycetaceae bacterium]|nr:YdiU family protein [Planctomycetaceae bacterium]